MSDEKEDKELLTQDEIDTLLNGVDDGDVDTQNVVKDGEAVAFDFTSQDKLVRGRMPTLEMINDRFARFFRTSIVNLMQRNAEIVVDGISMTKFGDYTATLHSPSSMNWLRIEPLRGLGLVTIDAKLVFKMVDLFFGGTGRVVNIEGREFTATEQRVVTRLLSLVFADLKQAWQSVMDIRPELADQEYNPLLSSVLAPTELIVVSSFTVEMDGGTGEFQVVFPASMLEPIKDTLDAGIQSDMDEPDEHFPRALRDELMHASLPVNCKVVQKEVALRDILDLEEGDVIPIDMPDTVLVTANEQPLFDAKLGVSGEKLALQILGRHQGE
jgi:flagellar motor switch protein FliM